jgi:hypothetical protein
MARDEVQREVFKKDGGQMSIETAMTDVRLVEVNLLHRGEPMRPLYVKILGVRPNNTVMISGRMKYFAALLGDRCISTNVTSETTRLFVRFYRAKFQVHELSMMISINGLLKAVPIPWAQIHNDKTDKNGKKTSTGRRGRAKPTIFLYLLAVYGIYEAFRRVCGAAPIFTTIHDKDKHLSLTQAGYVPVVSSPVKSKKELEIIAWIKEDEATVDMCNCLASLFYTMEYRPTNTDTIEKIEDKTVWLVVLGKVTERIIELGDKKELVTQEDLPYIVSDVLKHGAIGEKVKLKSYFVNLAHGLKPMATLKIEINGKEYEESSSGDGQYDAFVRALRKIYKVTLGRKFPMLTNYAVSIPPGGRTDAFVQTVITWNYDEQVFRTRGLDADQTEAAIKATMKMLNMIEDEYSNSN